MWNITKIQSFLVTDQSNPGEQNCVCVCVCEGVEYKNRTFTIMKMFKIGIDCSLLILNLGKIPDKLIAQDEYLLKILQPMSTKWPTCKILKEMDHIYVPIRCKPLHMPIINVEVQKKAPNQNKHTPLAAPFLYFYCELILYLLFIIIYHYRVFIYDQRCSDYFQM